MNTGHQFHLQWSNYGHNLANSFLKLFESESLSDVTLFCEGESYRAHRVVLAASSAHFQELFEQCSASQGLVVILDGTSSSNLRALLEFMYKGEVYVDDANLNAFLETAKRLQVKGLSLSQNDLQSISSEVVEERSENSTVTTSFTSTSNHEGISNQNANSLVLNQAPPSSSQNQHSSHPLSRSNSVHSPPNSFSSPSPSHNHAHPHAKKKLRLQSSPDGGSGDPIDYGGHLQPPPPRPMAPGPSPSPNLRSRMFELEHTNGRQQIIPGFPAFSPMYPPSSRENHAVLAQVSHAQSQPPQSIVIHENPNIRKIRSASTENTMPEDLSVKLEGREEDIPCSIANKQRSYSMDLSPEAPFGGSVVMGPGPGPGPSTAWPLPSPAMSGQNQQSHSQAHDITINAQSTPDGKKLKCPFCERLYGYETNLRAHIRQRHQGIRVPCPFCTRTFTRNNTVRRHVAREHRALLGGVRAFHPLNSESGAGSLGQGAAHGAYSSPPRAVGNSETPSPVHSSPTSNSSAPSSGGSGPPPPNIINASGGHQSVGALSNHLMSHGGVGGPPHVAIGSVTRVSASSVGAPVSSSMPMPSHSPVASAPNSNNSLSVAPTGTSTTSSNAHSSRSSSGMGKPVD